MPTSFNPRLPGGRRLVNHLYLPRSADCFNPRLPGGRRPARPPHCRCRSRFNPRLPGGRRLKTFLQRLIPTTVSIHAFRGEGDLLLAEVFRCVVQVSIHAFRGEGDSVASLVVGIRRCFNPRLPGGRRLVTVVSAEPMPVFQSTPSGGKATAYWSDAGYLCRCFNPRLPGGRRPASPHVQTRVLSVSIHAFRGEGDICTNTHQIVTIVFQSTPSGGKATLPGNDARR